MLGICNSAEAPRSNGSTAHIIDYVPPIVNFERRYKIFIPTRTDWDWDKSLIPPARPL